MKKFFFYLYLVLWIIYELQGTLYAHGSLISQGSLFLLMLMSLFYFGFANFRLYLPRPLILLTFLLLAWTMYGIIPLIFGTGLVALQVQPFNYLKGIYMSLLPIYAFYVFACRGQLTENHVRFLFFIFLALAILSFYDEQKIRLLNTTKEEVTNNAGYIVVSLLPLVILFRRKPIIQYLLLCVCMLFVFLGMKRGAIISGVLCSLWIMLESFRQDRSVHEDGSSRRRFWRFIATVAVVIGAFYGVTYLLNTSDYFNLRLEQTISGNASGREEMYFSYFDWYVNQDNLFSVLFGNGAFATLRFFGLYAHNDWLEILIDNGLLFALLYASFWVSLFVLFLKGKRGSSSKMILGSFIIIYFLKSLLSMTYNDVTIYAACAMGFAFSEFKHQAIRPRNGF